MKLGISTLLIATAISNITGTYTKKVAITINKYPNIYQQQTTEDGYNVKRSYLLHTTNLQTYNIGDTNSTIAVKGYQYTEIKTNPNDEEDYSCKQYIDYYIDFNYVQNNTIFQNIKTDFYGSVTNNGYTFYIEEYSTFYVTQGTNGNKINTFLTNNIITKTQLDELRNLSMNDAGSITEIDGSENYYKVQWNSFRKYLRIRAIVNFEGSGQELADTITTTQNLYTELQIELNYGAEVPAGYEVIDIPGLMFTILGMPFAWLSTAFNLTIFPGTPYAINLSHLFFAIIGSLILIVILKRLLK